jgi:hypothetical protein
MRAEFGAESSEGEGEEQNGRNSSLSNKSTSSQQKEVKTKGKKSLAPKRKVRFCSLFKGYYFYLSFIIQSKFQQ